MPSSWVNTEYNIHRIQHSPNTASTWDCLLSLHSHDFKLTPECSYSFRHTSLPVDRHQPVLHKSFKGKVTSSDSHCFELTKQWIKSQHLAHLPSTASRSPNSKYSSSLARSWPATSTSPNSVNHSLPVHLQTRSITASKCISEFTQSCSRIASPNSLDHGLGVYFWVHSIIIFRHTLNSSQAPSAASPDIPCV